MNNMPAYVQLASMSFKYIFFKSMITNKIYTEMPYCKEIYHFMNAHTVSHLPYWYHEYVYRNTIYSYWSTFYVEGSLNIHLTMPTCFILLYFTHICIFQYWRNKYIFLSLSSTNSLRPVDAYMCQESNLAFVMIMACRLIGAGPFFFLINTDLWFGIFWYQNLCRFMVGMLSVCYRFEFGIVGLLSVTIPALC